MIKWTELFEMQRELDDRIIREKGLQGKKLIRERTAAFLVELSEFANEARFFKFWSNNQKPITVETRHVPGKKVLMETYNPLLEEFADCIHFIIGIGLALGENQFLTDLCNGYESLRTNILDDFLDVHKNISVMLSFYEGLDIEQTIKWWRLSFLALMSMSQRLGLSHEQIVTAYKAKHAENHARQDRGY